MALSELLCTDLESVGAALALGADRIELCAALEVGGVTPGPGLLRATLAARDAASEAGGIRTEVVVLVRPRRGDFVYGAGDRRAALADVEAARTAGSDGVALGLLLEDGGLDLPGTGELVRAAGSMGVTFHRAFDHVPSPDDTLEALVDLGIHRVLTSGGAPSAWEGREALAQLAGRAGARIEVVAAGGVRGGNARELLAATGVPAIHGSCSHEVGATGARVALGRPGAPAEGSRTTLDPEDARRFVEAARAHVS